VADPEMPALVAALDRDRHGRPIPWFVHRTHDGTPDFRVIGENRISDAIRFAHCWVCGRTRGRHAAFVIGPMCGVNRVSAEPPSHLDCAIYSALACPFLTRPNMTRRPRGLPDLNDATPGVAIDRNPGVALIWSSRTWRPFQAWDGSGTLFDLGDPSTVRWFAHGREATRTEVLTSVNSGMQILEESCPLDDNPVASLADLHRQRARLEPLLPPAELRVAAGTAH
jgi:hypothetical protein